MSPNQLDRLVSWQTRLLDLLEGSPRTGAEGFEMSSLMARMIRCSMRAKSELCEARPDLLQRMATTITDNGLPTDMNDSLRDAMVQHLVNWPVRTWIDLVSGLDDLTAPRNRVELPNKPRNHPGNFDFTAADTAHVEDLLLEIDNLDMVVTMLVSVDPRLRRRLPDVNSLVREHVEAHPGRFAAAGDLVDTILAAFYPVDDDTDTTLALTMGKFHSLSLSRPEAAIAAG